MLKALYSGTAPCQGYMGGPSCSVVPILSEILATAHNHTPPPPFSKAHYSPLNRKLFTRMMGMLLPSVLRDPKAPTTPNPPPGYSSSLPGSPGPGLSVLQSFRIPPQHKLPLWPALSPVDHSWPCLQYSYYSIPQKHQSLARGTAQGTLPNTVCILLSKIWAIKQV